MTIAPPHASTDDADLHTTFGYEPQLQRHLGRYASFAAGFSFVSILTTVFQLFGLGFSFGGAAFFWTWPIVLLGQMLVALNFAELAARYPISGCIYQWSRRLAGNAVGWFAGWFMILAQVVTAAAAAIALQVVLPSVWSGFQIIGTDTALTSADGAANAALLGSLLLVVTTTINIIGIDLMSRINTIGVTCEIIGVVAVIGLFFFTAERSPDVVLTTTGAAGGSEGYVAAFLVSGLMAAYVMVGFDSAGELSEETKDPRRVAPRTILTALAVSGLGGGLMLLGALVSAPSLTDGRLSTEGLAYVLSSRLDSPFGTLLLLDVGIAITVCTLAIQTAGSRLIFSMARDGRLPASTALATVNPRTGTPALPAVVVGVLGIALLAVNAGNSALFTTLASVCIVMLYLAYLLVTTPLLLRRLQGWPRRGGTRFDEPATVDGHRVFALGRWGVPVNLLAVVWGLVMMINLAWPRAEIFDPSGLHPVLAWAAPLFVLGVLLVGLLAYPWKRPHVDVVTLPRQGGERTVGASAATGTATGAPTSGVPTSGVPTPGVPTSEVDAR